MLNLNPGDWVVYLRRGFPDWNSLLCGTLVFYITKKDVDYCLFHTTVFLLQEGLPRHIGYGMRSGPAELYRKATDQEVLACLAVL